MGLSRSLSILVLLSAVTGGPSVRAETATPTFCAQSRINPEMPMQDQDGLGTCYANVAALLLQNKLWRHRDQEGRRAFLEAERREVESPNYGADSPIATAIAARPAYLGTPRVSPLSYQHMALAQFLDADGPEGGQIQLTRRIREATTSLVSESGFVCGPIEAVKRHGYCTAGTFGHDAADDTVNVQRYVLVELARFLEERREDPRMTLLRQDAGYARLVEERLTAQLGARSILCRPAPGEPPSLTKARFIARRMLARLAQRPAGTEALFLALAPVAYVDGDASRGPRPEAILALANILLGDPRQSCNIAQALRLSPTDRCGGPVSWAEGYRARDYNVYSDDSRITGVPTQEDLYWRLAQQLGVAEKVPRASAGPNLQMASDLAAWNSCYRTRAGFDRATLDEAMAPMCFPFPLPSSDDFDLTQRRSWAHGVVEALQQFNRQENDARVRSFLRILAPNCEVTAQANLANLPPGLSCDRQEVEDVNDATDRMLAALCENKAVGVEVCTEFMAPGARPNVNTHNCRVRGQGVQGHNDHAMTVVGHRESGGQLQFLVQNSWGADCPWKNTSRQGDCEMNGSTFTGRWWVNSNLLLYNTVATTVLP